MASVPNNCWVAVFIAACIACVSASCPFGSFDTFDFCPSAQESHLIIEEYGSCGRKINALDALSAPRVVYKRAEVHKKYVLIMVDPDAPSSANPVMRWWRHWVVYDIEGADLKVGTITGTVPKESEYMPPTPPKGSGWHRYQFLLIEQPADVDPATWNLDDLKRGRFNLDEFISKAGLCDNILASYQYLAENSNY